MRRVIWTSFAVAASVTAAAPAGTAVPGWRAATTRQPRPAAVEVSGRWERSSPADEGIAPDALAAAVRRIRGVFPQLETLLIIRHGKIVLERYYELVVQKDERRRTSATTDGPPRGDRLRGLRRPSTAARAYALSRCPRHAACEESAREDTADRRNQYGATRKQHARVRLDSAGGAAAATGTDARPRRPNSHWPRLAVRA